MILNKQIQKNIRIMFGEDAQDRTQRVLKRLRDDKAKDEHIPGSLTLIGRCAVDHAAADIIEQLEAQVSRWIPVEERLPECADENVLVIVNGEHGITTFYDAYMLANYYPSEGWLIDGYEDWETPNVSFWLPLPEPPEGKPPIGWNSDDFVHGNHG